MDKPLNALSDSTGRQTEIVEVLTGCVRPWFW